MKKEDESFVKQKYLEMQALDEKMKQIDNQLSVIDNQIKEVLVTKKALLDFKKLEKGRESLISLANGIFVKGEVKDNSTLLVNVGADVVVEKSVDDTISLMDSQLDELEQYKSAIITSMDQLTLKVKEIEKIVDERVKNV